MLQSLATAAVVAISAIAWYIYSLLQKRRALNGLPQPPMQNLLMGHLHHADECYKIFPDMAHPHLWADYIRSKFNLPEIFYWDLRPFGPLWLYCADPEISSQFFTVNQSLPKSNLESDFLRRLLGDNNLLSLEGAHWKSLRSMFNPGFSAANVMTLVGDIVDAGLDFCEVLREKAETNEHFQLEEYATRLTIDVIGRVTLDADIHSQTAVHPIAKAFRARVHLMPPATTVFPWQGLDLLRPFKLWLNTRQLDMAIFDELEAWMERRNRDHISGQNVKRRTIIDLAIQAYEKEKSADEGSKGPTRITSLSQLPPSLLSDIVVSIKTFFFAGHDTTSSTIAWALHLLHRHPAAQAALTTELNNIFPSSTTPSSVATALKSDPYLLNQLPYLTAVLKETTRIFAPASTVRSPIPSAPSFTHPRTGQIYPLNQPNTHIWPAAHLMHRNTRFFPSPAKFIPERFIPSLTPFPDAELFTPAGKDAWRPFEKGARNCIGQELAMIEMKAILAMTVREFEFVVEVPGTDGDGKEVRREGYEIPENVAQELGEGSEYGRAVRQGAHRDRWEGHVVYPVLIGSAKPAGGCPGRVYLRKRE